MKYFSLMKLSSSVERLPSSPTRCSDPIEKLFSWDPEKPRPISEYIDGNFSKPFNIVAPELRVIGGLGQVRCVKKNRRQVLVNRPTLAQKISHTTKKLLPDFSLINEVKPVACNEKKKLSIQKHVERVKFADNLPDIEKLSSAVETKEFNHENPFNLDLDALNECQRQRSEAEGMMRQRRFQAVRRIMETKKLKTEGVEEILQELRDEKFKLPAFFDIAKSEKENTIMSEIDEDETESLKSSINCAEVSFIDKPKNREIIKRHYQKKRNKLRQQLLTKKIADEAAQKEIRQCKQREQENLIFCLADESFPSSECNYDEPNKIREASFHLSNQMNDFELSHNVDDISCGQRIGNKVVLRSFHDPLYKEPRGRDNLHIVKNRLNDDCLTNNESFYNIPKKKEPPKGKLFSSLRGSCDPNDDKTCIFSNNMNKLKKESIKGTPQSAIRNHIQQIDFKMKQRNCKSKVKKMRSIDAKEQQHRYQRMSFMGIPTSNCKKSNKIERIVGEISKNSLLVREDNSTSKDKDSNAKTVPEGIKLMPTIPVFREMQNENNDNGRTEIEKDCEQSKVIPTFLNAKPRGSDPELLRIDKSLPWIQHSINATRIKLQNNDEECRITLDKKDCIDNDVHAESDKNKIADENQSELKRRYNDIIATKLCKYNTINDSMNELKNDDRKSELEIQSASTLSSTGTNFTNDSGSYIVVQNEKIPKSRLNIGKKFQNKSLITTEIREQSEREPYFIGNISVMRELLKPPDRFHTYRTRSNANIRQRIKVEPTNYEDEIIGHKSLLATDIDESYVKEFYHERSHTEYRFKRVTAAAQMRENFRKKIEIFYMKEKLLLDQIQANKDEQVMQKLSQTISEYDKFLETQKELAYRRTKRKMQEVKDYYVATDKLYAEYNELKEQIEPMKMKIFFLANEFVQRVILRDFQYLLMPNDWRLKHDHLHLDASGNLEDYRTSIENREARNLWDRSCISIDTIIAFINDVYEPSKRELLKTFANADEFMATYRRLQTRSMKDLSKFTHPSMVFCKVQHEYAMLEKRNQELIEHYERTTSSIRDRWKFANNRVNTLKKSVQVILDKKLHESSTTPILNTLTGVIDVLYQKLLCKDNCVNAKHFTNLKKFAEIEAKVLAIFTKLDEIPKELTIELEKEIRQKRRRKWRLAEKAYKTEMNIDHAMMQVERLFKKPLKKEKKVGKLPRSVLKKKPQKEVKKPPLLNPLEEEYLRAFTNFMGNDANDVKFENLKEFIEKIKNESIPFYIDRFVESMGYTIKKHTARDIDNIIKDEMKNMKFKDMLPSVTEKVLFWDNLREKTKNENIEKTLYLYEGIKK